MKVTVATLVAAGIKPTQARIFEAPLAAACARFAIDTKVRVAAFVAQASHESAGFARVEESLYYRSAETIMRVFGRRLTVMRAAQLTRNPQALANAVYATRNGNGDEASGDGWRYRGRGLFQLTGRGNYRRAALALGVDYVAQPALVAQPEDAALTAAWYWHAIDGNDLADASLFDQITEAINGPAMHAADERRSLFENAMRAFA